MKENVKRYGAEVRMYDNGGGSFDRYTVIPPRYAGGDYRERNGAWQAIASSVNPFRPQGFGQHVSADPGPHLGKRIHWRTLPTDVKTFARQNYPQWTPSE